MENFVFFKRLRAPFFLPTLSRCGLIQLPLCGQPGLEELWLNPVRVLLKLEVDCRLRIMECHDLKSTQKRQVWNVWRLHPTQLSSSIFPRRSLDLLPSLCFSDLWYYIRGFGFLDDVSRRSLGRQSFTPQRTIVLAFVVWINCQPIGKFWIDEPFCRYFLLITVSEKVIFSFCPTWLLKFLLETKVKVL